jgi:hypothetical protein
MSICLCLLPLAFAFALSMRAPSCRQCGTIASHMAVYILTYILTAGVVPQDMDEHKAKIKELVVKIIGG